MLSPLVAGNWKMNGSLSANQLLIENIIKNLESDESVELAVFPTFVHIPAVAEMLAGSKVSYGAQDVSAADSGAYTGEVSVSMLAELGCRYVIIGHSERRNYHDETDALVAKKARLVSQAKLCPIVCLGETLAEREAGIAKDVIERQLNAVLEVLTAEQIDSLVLAYEPVWAIGTGRTATPEQAQEIHYFIRKQVERKYSGKQNSLRILYGGSVKPENARQLFEKDDINGALVGGASLDEQDFLNIVKAARN